MHNLHILPPNCQIQLFPHTATFKLSLVELFVHSSGKPAHFKMSPAHASIHSFIHSLRQRCVCFVQWRQKQQQNTVAHEGHLSHTHAARTPTEDSNLVTCFFVIKCTNRKGRSTCYGCFSQPLYLYVCVLCMHMYMFRCARAHTCVVSVHVVHIHMEARGWYQVSYSIALYLIFWGRVSQLEPRAHWFDSPS